MQGGIHVILKQTVLMFLVVSCARVLKDTPGMDRCVTVSVQLCILYIRITNN
jgi:hypothetical protein